MKFMNKIIALMLTAGLAFSVMSQEPPRFTGKKKTQSKRTKALTPEEQLKTFKLREGFIIELVASEADGIINPIDLTFDDAGRIWTQTALMYPMDPLSNMSFRQTQKMLNSKGVNKYLPALEKARNLYQLKTKGKDKILIVNNLFSPDAQKEVKVWAEGLTIPQSILPYKNGAFIAHGSEMLFLNDSDGDGKSDEHKTILTGFGFTDTHTMSHTLVRGPGGWVHFSHGAMNKGLVTAVKSGRTQRVDFSKIGRFSLDGNNIELVNAGLNNIWGFQLRAKGQWYGTEANDKGYSVVPMEPQTAMYGIGNEKLREYQPFLSPLHKFLVGGTGISGLAFAEDESGSFPKEWKDVALLANPITSTINAVRVVRNEDGTVSAEHLEDFLKCDDDWFRPVNMEFGPDGCLYIADWYNKIISHNEVPRSHPDRDRKHGRIWRIRHVSQKPVEVKDYYQVATQELLRGLESPSIWEKRAAWHQIADRQAMELVYPLVRMAEDQNLNETTRIMALWSLESLSYLDFELIKSLTKSSIADLQREAIRSLAGMNLTHEQLFEFLKGFENHKNPMIRSQVLRTISECNLVSPQIIDLLVTYCRPGAKAKHPQLGGDYEREFERFLARKALEQFPKELNDYLKSDLAKAQPASHLAWAAEALSAKDKVAAFMKSWKKESTKPLSEKSFLTIAEIIDSEGVYDAVKETFTRDSAKASGYALKHQIRVQSVTLTKLLSESLQGKLEVEKPKLLSLYLKLIDSYGLDGLEDEIFNLLKSGRLGEEQIIICLNIVTPKSDNQVNSLLAILSSQNSSELLRNSAFEALVKSKSKSAESQISEYFKSMQNVEKESLIKKFSSTYYGSVFIAAEMKKDKSLVNLIDYDTLVKLSQYNQGDEYLSTLLSRKKSEMKKIEAVRKKKIEIFTKIIEAGKGNPAAGKPLFDALCLSCHSAAGKGVGFAPPLDGSAHRDNHGLLTSILDPNAAVEANYYVFKITKKDGSTVEGFCEKQDSRGVTLRFMGGAKLFVPASDIKSKNYVFGKSVMPGGLIDNMADSQVADILAYIKSLK